MNAKQTTLSRKSTRASVKATPRTLAVMKRPVQAVLIEYHDNGARKVCVAGSFNDWRPDGLDMINMGGGRWAKELLLPPGTYEYRLVVDGKWITDPAVEHTVPTPFGETNALLVVRQAPQAPPGQQASL